MEAIYARQSLDKKDSLSIETQIELCKHEAASTDVKVYIDKGFSGKNTNRPQFIKMMDDVEKGLVSKVIVYKLDRLSRSLLDFAGMIDKFKRTGVEFLSTREKFDTSTPIGNAMLSIIMVFAQLERETIQIRVRDSFNARSERGAYDAIAPFGYEKAKALVAGKSVSTLALEPEAAELVLKLFKSYAFTEQSLGALAKSMNRSHIGSPGGADWDSGKLSRIMANPLYVKADADVFRYYEATGAKLTNPIDDYIGENGCVTYGAWDRKRRKFSQWDNLSISIGLHPGLVDSYTFLRCQHKLMQNVQIGNEGKGKHTWMTGLMKCGYCGHAMRVVAAGRCIPRVTCSGKTNYGICDKYEKRWLVSELEQSVASQLLHMVRQKQTLSAQVEMDEDREDKRLKLEIAKVDQKINNLITALSEGTGATMKYLNEKIAALEEEKKQLAMQRQANQSGKATENELRQFGDILILWDDMDMEQKRQVAKLLIEQISVYNDRIQIRWRYNFLEQQASA